MNLNENMYNIIRQEYYDDVKEKVKKNILRFKHEHPRNEYIDFFNEKMIKDLLIGTILGNENESWVENYRKSMILANYKIKAGPMQGIYSHLKDMDHELNSNAKRLEIYKKFRKELVRLYDNPLISEVMSSNSKYFDSIKNFTKLQGEIEQCLKPYNDIGEIVFNYSNIISKNSNLRTKILSATNVNICPYCNRQFINTYDKKKRTIAQLDHFYPKKFFILLSLNLYNFIPSCAHCNTVLKREKIIEFMYPINNMGNKKKIFEFSPANHKQIIGWQPQSIKVHKSDRLDYEQLYRNYILEKMHLESIYEFHEDFAQSLIEKSYLLSDQYIKGIENIIGREISMDVKDLLYGYNSSEQELLGKPLSKLAQDILFNK